MALIVQHQQHIVGHQQCHRQMRGILLDGLTACHDMGKLLPPVHQPGFAAAQAVKFPPHPLQPPMARPSGQ